MRSLLEEEVALGDLTVYLHYKEVQRITLRIDKQGRAIVSLPFHKKSEALAFVRSKLDWLKKHLERRSVEDGLPCPDEGFDGKHVWLWGKCYEAEFLKASTTEQVLMRDSSLVFTYKGALTQRKQELLVEKFYWQCLTKMLEGALEKWQPKLNLYCSSYKLRRLKSKWGRCNIGSKELLFNVGLVHRPVACLEYVVLHELAHLYEASHNARFKAFLTYYMENWQQRRKLLNEFTFRPNNN